MYLSNVEQAMLKMERKTFKEKMGSHVNVEENALLSCLRTLLSSSVGEIRHQGEAAAVADAQMHGEALCSPQRGDQNDHRAACSHSSVSFCLLCVSAVLI